jgi:hypothetical protein
MGVDASSIEGVGIYYNGSKDVIVKKLLECGITDWDYNNPPDSTIDDYESELEDWICDVSWNDICEVIQHCKLFPNISAQCTYGYEEAEDMFLFINKSKLVDMYEAMPKFIEEVAKLGITITVDDIKLHAVSFFS